MNTSPKTVLVLGANGRFGQAAVAAFSAAGWQVLAQSRQASQHPLAANVTAVLTPLDQIDELAQQAQGVSIVIYAVNTAYTQWHKQALPTARLGMDLAQRLNATFMLPGNVYNFGEHMPALLQEDTLENPTTRKGYIRCAIEAELAQRAKQGLNSVVLRAGDFFGGGKGVWMDIAIVKSLAQGKLVYPGPMDVAHAWAYLPDFAKAFVAIAESRRQPGLERLHFAGYTLTGAQLLDTIETVASKLGIRPKNGFKRGGMPWGIIRAGGLVVPLWREVAEMAYLWSVPHALDGRRLQQRVGSLPMTPVKTAICHTLIDLGLAPASQAQKLDASTLALK